MRIIFCDSGFNSREVDYMFVEEYNAAESESISISLISFKELRRGNIDQALKRVKESMTEEIGMYRGWMLKPQEYTKLYESLRQKNIKLINSPTEYKYCHYLPENYETIREYTPKTIYKKIPGGYRVGEFVKELEEFEGEPIIVKDYVKSQKHYWEEACYIPKSNNLEIVERITKRFIELQEEDLNEGIVYREFVELEELTNHSKSGMPLTKEFRLFIKNGEIKSCFKYWDEGKYNNVEPEIERFADVIKKIKSNFFSMDIAKKKGGDWIIIEIGDGQVSGLPENANKKEFYRKIKS